MRKNFRGAVSLFIVIFTTLLITVITVSFVRIMVTGQQEATSSDLSQSAYDSAQAGVEDAKRAIMHYIKSGYDGQTDINSTKCNEAVVDYAGVTENSGRVSVGDNANQYYTCVTISMNTSDYEGYLARNSSKIIPLVGESDFNAVQIQWYTDEDLGGESLQAFSNTTTNYPLFSNWTLSTPSMMRAQFIQFNSSSFQLSDFDKGDYASTMFLYPKKNSAASEVNSLPLNQSRVQSTSPSGINCFSPTTSSSGYACTARLTGINGGSGQSVFLNLTALYNSANYKITLYNTNTDPATVINFNGVQPEIDSTGQADDLLRRVKVRVETLNSSFIYPEAAVDMTSDFCKNFMVTTSSYKDYGSCFND